MSEDPENMKNQEALPPAASEQTESTPEGPMLEASQPEPNTPEGSAPEASKLEASDIGEGLISDFRQSLVEEESTETASKSLKEKKPGFIQRLTGKLTRKTGKLDEDGLPPISDASAPQRGTAPATGFSTEANTTALGKSELEIPEWAAADELDALQDNPIPSIEADSDIPQWSSVDAQTAAQAETVPSARLSNKVNTAALSENDLDILRADSDDQSPARPGKGRLPGSVTKAPEPIEPAQLTSDILMSESEIEQSLLGLDQPHSEAAGSGTAGAVVVPHESETETFTTEDGFLDGLVASTTQPDQSAKTSAFTPTPDQPASNIFQPKQTQSFWRRVTDILRPPVKPEAERESEVIPDAQLLDRLSTNPIDSLPDILYMPAADQTAPQPGLEEQAAPSETPVLFQVDEIQPAQIPLDLASDLVGESPPVVEEDQAVWSAYVDVSSGDPTRSSEPSPFVDNSLTELTLGAEAAAQTSAYEIGSTDSSAPESAPSNSQFQDGLSPFLTEDSPWLGELRGAIDTDDDLSAPSPEPEIETPPEKSDIWNRLMAEEKRSEQVVQSPPSAENAFPQETSAFWGVSASEDVAQEPNNIQESETPLMPESQVEPVLRDEIFDFEHPAPAEPEVANPHEPFWSTTGRTDLTDGYGSWFEDTAQEQSEMLGLPNPSEEALQEQKESTRLYDSIFEDQKQEEMRSMLLDEGVSQGGVPAIGPLPDFTAEAREKQKSWWARLTKVQIGMVIMTAIVLIALAAVTVVYIFHRTSAVVATSQPAVSVQLSKPNGPYPVGIQLTGGWIFSLNRSTLEQGFWNPKSGEWLDGTQIRRVVALPWSRQTDAVIRSFQPGDPIGLFFSNKQTIFYKVSEVKQVAVDDVSVLTDTHPSLAVILYQPSSKQRWVVIASQQP